MEKKVITDAAVVEAIRAAMPIVSRTEDGLASKDGFMYRSQPIDLNEAVLPGWYSTYGPTANSPANESGVVAVFAVGSAYITQLYMCLNFNKLYYRQRVSVEWKPWKEVNLSVVS